MGFPTNFLIEFRTISILIGLATRPIIIIL